MDRLRQLAQLAEDGGKAVNVTHMDPVTGNGARLVSIPKRGHMIIDGVLIANTKQKIDEVKGLFYATS